MPPGSQKLLARAQRPEARAGPLDDRVAGWEPVDATTLDVPDAPMRTMLTAATGFLKAGPPQGPRHPLQERRPDHGGGPARAHGRHGPVGRERVGPEPSTRTGMRPSCRQRSGLSATHGPGIDALRLVLNGHHEKGHRSGVGVRISAVGRYPLRDVRVAAGKQGWPNHLGGRHMDLGGTRVMVTGGKRLPWA